MPVSIVEERRNVLRRENTPAIRRNTRKGNRARIKLNGEIFPVLNVALVSYRELSLQNANKMTSI